MSIIISLIIGAAAGWIAGHFMRGGGFGLLGNIVVGVIGAFIGGFLPGLLDLAAGGLLGSLIAAVVGAVVLLFVVGLIKRAMGFIDQEDVSEDYQRTPKRQPPIDTSPGFRKTALHSENEPSNVSETPPAHQSTKPKQINVRKIFVSYRRDDSPDVAGRIYDQLVNSFGKTSIFRDIDAIPLGVDFRKHLQDAVAQADVLLAIIGPRWLGDNPTQTTTRLDDPKDYVRIELAAALNKDIPVIPILVSGAKMPAESDLPAMLATFSYRNATQIRPDPDFHNDMERLVSGIKGIEPKPTK